MIRHAFDAATRIFEKARSNYIIIAGIIGEAPTVIRMRRIYAALHLMIVLHASQRLKSRYSFVDILCQF